MERNSSRQRKLQIIVVLIAASVGFGAGIALASQPQMESALRSLQSAQGELGRVTLNKGGHAARARGLVAQAISEVEGGIQYGREHGL